MVRTPKGTDGLLVEMMTFVKKQFERQEKQLDRMEGELSSHSEILRSNQEILQGHQETLEKTSEDARDIRESLLLQDKRLDEIESVGRSVQRPIDKDSVKIIGHERRISRIEQRSIR
jgi:septal ring factor EnvC (AmiA/AmiB activator)